MRWTTLIKFPVAFCGGSRACRDPEAAAALDQNAARHRHQPALRQRVHRIDKIGLLLRALEQRPRSHTHGERAIGLAVGDLAAQQAGAVLRRGDFHAAARIEHGDDEGLQFLLDRLGKRGVENFAGDVEGQFGHGSVPFCMR